jgi:hypothetical protein
MENKISIRYKFKNSSEIQTGLVTRQQFEDLKKIEMIEFCEILQK